MSDTPHDHLHRRTDRGLSSRRGLEGALIPRGSKERCIGESAWTDPRRSIATSTTEPGIPQRRDISVQGLHTDISQHQQNQWTPLSSGYPVETPRRATLGLVANVRSVAKPPGASALGSFIPQRNQRLPSCHPIKPIDNGKRLVPSEQQVAGALNVTAVWRHHDPTLIMFREPETERVPHKPVPLTIM